MNNRDLAHTLLKVFGVLFLVRGIYLIPNFIYSIGSGLYWALIVAVPLLFLIFVGFVLIYSTEGVAKNIGIADASYEIDSGGTNILHRVAYSVLGVFFFLKGLASLSAAIVMPLYQKISIDESFAETGSEIVYISNANIGLYAEATFEIIAGIVLFFGADKLVHIWQRYRRNRVLIDYKS